MISSTLFRLLILITLFSLPTTANAHKLRVFAWVEGGVIVGETAFSGKRKPKDAEITVQNDANQTVLLTTRTDDLGKFNFAIPEQAVQQQLDLLIVVNAGEGHRGEWPLPVGEYLGKKSVQINTTPKMTTTAKTTKQNIQTDHQVLRRIVAEELDKQMGPLNKKLAETQDDKPDMRDILGGIGYILGLAGLLAWLKTKKQKED